MIITEQWLKQNFLNQMGIHKFLNASLGCLCAKNNFSKKSGEIRSLDNALDVIKTAFLNHLPNLSKYIEQAFSEVEISLTSPRDDLKPPYMIDRGKEGAFICIEYDSSARSIVNLTHEMAHVVQLIASNRVQMPPLFREMCAFIGENIILDYTLKNNEGIFHDIFDVMKYDDSIYLGSDVRLLKTAFEKNQTTYNYRWNYPIARYIANLVYDNASIKQIEELFLAGENAAQILPINDIIHSCSPKNYLPKAPSLKEDGVAQSAYMQIGMMVMLDMDNKKGNSKKKIEAYYEDTVKHMQNQTVFIALDYSKKPIGYVTWDKIEKNSINITNITEPFTDSNTLLKSLEQHLPKDIIIIDDSINCPKEEQSA